MFSEIKDVFFYSSQTYSYKAFKTRNMSINPKVKTEIKELLYFYLNYYGNYHSQKETIVWTGLAIYVSLATAVVSFAHDKTFFWRDAMFLSLFSFSIGLFVKAFLKTQLSAKSIATVTVEASHNILLQLLAGKLNDFEFENSIGDIAQHPKTITLEMERIISESKLMPMKVNLIQVFIKLFTKLNRNQKIEHFIFIVFWICNIVLMSVWWKNLVFKN